MSHLASLLTPLLSDSSLLPSTISTLVALSDSPNQVLGDLHEFFNEKLSSTHDKAVFKLFFDVLRGFLSNSMIPRPAVFDALFFPSKENEAKLISYLLKAEKEVDLCIFTLTNNNLSQALVDLMNRNVTIRIITDDANLKHSGTDVFSLAMKIPIRTDKNLFTHMHNKYVIIDRKILVTGSFNWTAQAVSRNQENIIAIQNEEMAEKYLADFEKLWKIFEENKVEGKGNLERFLPKEPKKRGRKKKVVDPNAPVVVKEKKPRKPREKKIKDPNAPPKEKKIKKEKTEGENGKKEKGKRGRKKKERVRKGHLPVKEFLKKKGILEKKRKRREEKEQKKKSPENKI